MIRLESVYPETFFLSPKTSGFPPGVFLCVEKINLILVLITH